MESLKVDGFAAAERHLEQVAIEMRGAVLRSGLRKAGTIVSDRSKQLCPPSNAPGTNAEWQPMQAAISVEVKEFNQGGGMYAIIGPKKETGIYKVRTRQQYRARHAHLVEKGHRMVTGGTATHLARGRTYGASKPERTGKGAVRGMVPPYPFLQPAADATRSEQSAAVLEGIQKAVKRALRG